MAKPARANKPAKLSRPEKKALRAAKKVQRRELRSNIAQTFKLTREHDPRLMPYLVLFGVIVAAVTYLLFFWWTGSVWVPIPVALVFGLFAALITFNRRAQRAMYTQAEGQPGAAG